MGKKIIIVLAAAAVVVCLVLVFYNSNKEADKTETVTADNAAIDYDAMDWRNDPDIGKVQPGYYKRVGIVKDGEAYDEMLKLNEIGSRGYLIISDDGAAVFDLDGEKTEYVYDEYNLYPAEDTERSNGASYVFIRGRIVVDDGTTITQYLKLTDEELESYMESAEKGE